MMPEKRKYSNPPIQEAVCEIHFDAIDSINAKIDTLKGLWLKEYPHQKIVKEEQFQVNISSDNIQYDRKEMGQRLICTSSDQQRLVQVSSGFIAINQLKPYPGWEESFRDTILNRASDFWKASDVGSATKAVLRYINNIAIPTKEFVWGEWFQFELPVASKVNSFQMAFNSTIQDCSYSVTIVGNSVDTKSFRVILDLAAAYESPKINVTELPRILEIVHRPHNEIFEKYLTDKVRALFD